MLTYKLFLFVLYVLTNYFIVCYNYNVGGESDGTVPPDFFSARNILPFFFKNRVFPKKGY